MLKIKIETKNDAFKEGLEMEIRRCLRDVSCWIGLGRKENGIYDLNGNKVGYFKLTDK